MPLHKASQTSFIGVTEQLSKSCLDSFKAVSLGAPCSCQHFRARKDWLGMKDAPDFLASAVAFLFWLFEWCLEEKKGKKRPIGISLSLNVLSSGQGRKEANIYWTAIQGLASYGSKLPNFIHSFYEKYSSSIFICQTLFWAPGISIKHNGQSLFSLGADFLTRKTRQTLNTWVQVRQICPRRKNQAE